MPTTLLLAPPPRIFGRSAGLANDMWTRGPGVLLQRCRLDS